MCKCVVDFAALVSCPGEDLEQHKCSEKHCHWEHFVRFSIAAQQFNTMNWTDFKSSLNSDSDQSMVTNPKVQFRNLITHWHVLTTSTTWHTPTK